MFKGSKNAFTLAEVLITLGIIGVVAAMTMPTLLNSTQAARSKTGFKKVMNVLNQAVVVNSALEDADLSSASSTGEGSILNIFKERTNVLRVEEPTSGNASGNYVLYFNDGMTFEFPKGAAECSINGKALPTTCKGVIDTIGGPEAGKGPNTLTSGGISATQDKKRVKTEDIGDRWAVKFYDDKVEPNNAAGRIIMYGKNTVTSSN